MYKSHRYAQVKLGKGGSCSCAHPTASHTFSAEQTVPRDASLPNHHVDLAALLSKQFCCARPWVVTQCSRLVCQSCLPSAPVEKTAWGSLGLEHEQANKVLNLTRNTTNTYQFLHKCRYIVAYLESTDQVGVTASCEELPSHRCSSCTNASRY